MLSAHPNAHHLLNEGPIAAGKVQRCGWSRCLLRRLLANVATMALDVIMHVARACTVARVSFQPNLAAASCWAPDPDAAFP